MNAKTAAKLAEIISITRAGNPIYPAFLQPIRGIDASVSAAIRAAKAKGIIEQAGIDGCGKPYYRAALPTSTHAGTETAQ